MATWKKVIVSGSDISQLNNDAGYLTSVTMPNAFATASFNGTNLLADSEAGTLNFASSSGEGLTISADAGTDTLTFGLSAIPNNSLANSSVTLGDTTINLGDTVTTLNNLTLTNVVASGSFSGSFQGDGSGLTGLASTLNISGSTGDGTVDLLTQTLSVLGGTNINTTATGQSITVNLDNNISVTDATITGDLTVFGTASFQNTTNLEVSDRFVLLASGSNSAGDGGLVVQQATQDVGELFGFDSTAVRWGVTSSFSANQSDYTPDAFMAAVTTLASTDPNSSGPDSRYNAAGNIFVSSDDESIWIYS
jgi:hypothetical protein